MSGEYVFTYPSFSGPCVEKLPNAQQLLAYAAGWSTGSSAHPLPPERMNLLLIVSPREVRAP